MLQAKNQTFEMLKAAFGSNALKKTALCKWYSKFEQGEYYAVDEPGPGRPSSISTKKIETAKELLDSDRRMTIRDITIGTGHTFGTVFTIIHNELGMRRIGARWLRHMFDENAMRKKRQGMLQAAILHHDNAPSHRAA